MAAQRFRAVVAYDGTDFFGFQRQLRERTVQGEIEQALDRITGQKVTVIGAGRTDSGVHARGQVIAFETDWAHPPTALQRALNAELPVDTAVMSLTAAAPGFHPRYDAKSRRYEYYIYNSPIRNPLKRLYTWQVFQPLDLARLNEATRVLVGEHDFATFGQPPQGENTVRHVMAAGWRQQAEMFVFDIEANAFLYRMVRSLVGSLVAVGRGRQTVADFERALAACDRTQAGQTCPPQGLFLVSVTYEE